VGWQQYAELQFKAVREGQVDQTGTTDSRPGVERFSGSKSEVRSQVVYSRRALRFLTREVPERRVFETQSVTSEKGDRSIICGLKRSSPREPYGFDS